MFNRSLKDICFRFLFFDNLKIIDIENFGTDDFLESREMRHNR